MKQWYVSDVLTGYGIESAVHDEAMKWLANVMAAHIANEETIVITIDPGLGKIMVTGPRLVV